MKHRWWIFQWERGYVAMWCKCIVYVTHDNGLYIGNRWFRLQVGGQ